MHYGYCGIEQWTSARQRAAAVITGLVLTVMMATVIHSAAATVTPSIWVELEEMRPPCKGDSCTRELQAPGVVIVGTGFAADLPVQVRFVSLDGTRPSMIYKTDPYTAAGDITLLTGERVCNDWLGSPLEASGLPEEHAGEVRAAPLTDKSGVAAIGSNILYLYTCGDGGVGHQTRLAVIQPALLSRRIRREIARVRETVPHPQHDCQSVGISAQPAIRERPHR